METGMKARIYERLSSIYDLDWGAWSNRYVALIQRELENIGVSRAKMIDFACGTGNLAIALAKLGHSVLGIDVCSNMIEVARSKVTGNIDIQFEVADMRSYRIESEFDCATCTFDAVNYLLTDADVEALLRNAANGIKPGGLFIFDSVTELMYLRHDRDVYRRKLGGSRFSQRHHYDSKRRVATTKFDFSDGSDETHVQRPYNIEEIGGFLQQTGFELVRARSGFNDEPLSAESDRLICVAKRMGK